MTNFVVDVFESEKNHAGPKAKNDVVSFLKDEGFSRILIDSEFSRLDKLFYYPLYLKKKASQITNHDSILIQHPMNIGKEYESLFINYLKKTGCNIVILVHDLASFRHENRLSWKEEIQYLNKANSVIAHNSAMINFLKKKGVKKEMISLDVFDYRVVTTTERNLQTKDLMNINFAGNMNKSTFINKISISNSIVYLFGLCDNIHSLPIFVKYEGVFSPEKIAKKLHNGFGLVWDGPSPKTCEGFYGEYLLINNPHKVSLYLAAGIPIIVWDKAAIAKFVIDNGVGYTISCLEDIEKITTNISEESLEEMKFNIRRIQKRVVKGHYLISALNKLNILT